MKTALSEEYQFHSHPVPYPKTAYQTAKKKYLETVRELKAVQSIYEIGQGGAPGISDIDLLVVLAPNSRLSYRALSILQFDYTTKYLFMHDPLVFGSDFANALNRWGYYEDEQMHWLYGEEIPIIGLPNQERSSVHGTMLVEHLILRYPRDLLGMQLKKEFNVRETLCHLNSYRYLFHLFESFIGSLPEGWRAFSTLVEQFRKSWFDLDAELQRLGFVQLVSEASRIGLELIEQVSSYLSETQKVRVSSTEALFPTMGFWVRGMLTVFDPQWSIDRSQALMESVYRQTGLCVMFLPWNLQYLLYVYASCAGSVSYHISQFYSGYRLSSPEVEAGLMNAALGRCTLLNRHFEFLKSSGVLYRGANFVGWGHSVDYTTGRRLTRPMRQLYRRFYALRSQRLLADVVGRVC